jgi:hypothetical protein
MKFFVEADTVQEYVSGRPFPVSPLASEVQINIQPAIRHLECKERQGKYPHIYEVASEAGSRQQVSCHLIYDRLLPPTFWSFRHHNRLFDRVIEIRPKPLQVLEHR